MFTLSEHPLHRYPGLFVRRPPQPPPAVYDSITMAYHTIDDVHTGGSGGGGGADGGGGMRGAGGGGGRLGYTESEVSYSDYTWSSSSKRESRHSAMIVVIFLVELLLLACVVVTEYFLRWTDVFPVRRQNFTCSDISISCTSRDKELMSHFAFSGRVSDLVVYCLTLGIPPMVVVVGEVGLYAVSITRRPRILHVAHTFCATPHILRRLLRFLGVFLFGAFALMVFSDVTRNMIGRLRPDFLETCDVNLTLCSQLSSLDDSACLNTDKMQLRSARTSFPSVNTALSSYAAVFISVYLHGAWRCHAVRIARVFLTLTFLLLSAVGALSEYCTCISHWTDVAAGWTAGLTTSLYLGMYVLNGFQDEVTQAEIQQMLRTILDDVYWTYGDKSHLARPSDHQQHSPASQTVPRVPTMPEYPTPTPAPPSSAPPSLNPAVASSALGTVTAAATAATTATTTTTTTTMATTAVTASAGGSRQHQPRQRARPFTMFQRDLSETVEQHQHQHRRLQQQSSNASTCSSSQAVAPLM